MKLIQLSFFTTIILFSNLLYADMFTPTVSCSKPYKPYKFNSEYEVTQYFNSVEKYKRCIADFVEKQSREANNHQKAASNAIEEWNRFVKYEMK
ncbi:hypothetical protein SKM62_11400 [Acinetobacter faecalis]|jgi:hypothetical protein|uniref:DUF1311 domain-containing protein n=1 Tax=Acinetobacter faecalis TaxID=2665161 RepID=A0ABU5GMN2_9GAMM|nr:hypothetical protein [Acinetobacter faecalis]MDY6537512.1 hypothetical protein [Acinetobacter faecalis]MDY6551612.1 hypothetical protein [Acinetobacter faecalis]